MKIEHLLSETFAEHEHLTPDPDQVMLAVQHRTETPSRALGWTQAGAAAAAFVAVVATSTWGISELRGHHPGQPLAQRPQTVASTAAKPASTAAKPANTGPKPANTGPKPAGIAALTMPYDLGWLPPGAAHYVSRRINVGGTSMTSPPLFDGEYAVDVASTSGALSIDTQQVPGSLSEVRFKSGPGAAVTVNGRPGIESVNASHPGGYELYFIDSAGGRMYVNVAWQNGETGPVDVLRTIGRQIAAGISLPGTAKVMPTYGLGYLPAGLRVCAFDVQDVDGLYGLPPYGATTAYSVGTSASQDAASTVEIETSPGMQPSGVAGRLVQGRPTQHNTVRGYNTLFVVRAVGSEPISIASMLPLAELYKIGDGLVLPR